MAPLSHAVSFLRQLLSCANDSDPSFLRPIGSPRVLSRTAGLDIIAAACGCQQARGVGRGVGRRPLHSRSWHRHAMRPSPTQCATVRPSCRTCAKGKLGEFPRQVHRPPERGGVGIRRASRVHDQVHGATGWAWTARTATAAGASGTPMRRGSGPSPRTLGDCTTCTAISRGLGRLLEREPSGRSRGRRRVDGRRLHQTCDTRWRPCVGAPQSPVRPSGGDADRHDGGRYANHGYCGQRAARQPHVRRLSPCRAHRSAHPIWDGSVDPGRSNHPLLGTGLERCAHIGERRPRFPGSGTLRARRQTPPASRSRSPQSPARSGRSSRAAGTR